MDVHESAGWRWAYDHLSRGIKTRSEVRAEAHRYPLPGWVKGALRAIAEWEEEQRDAGKTDEQLSTEEQFKLMENGNGKGWTG